MTEVFSGSATDAQIAALLVALHMKGETVEEIVGFARALLDQMAAGNIPRADLTPFHAHQIRSMGDQDLTSKLSSVWGELRDSDSERRQRIGAFKKSLDQRALIQGDLGRGRVLFDRLCGNCHRLHGSGGADWSRLDWLGPRQPGLPAREHHRPRRFGERRFSK